MNQKLKDSIVPLLVVVPMIALAIWFYVSVFYPDEMKAVKLIKREELTEKLNIYIWRNYIPEDGTKDLNDKNYYLYNEFAKEYGIDVTVKYFDTNEELLSRLLETKDNPQYDIVMPSNFLVPELVKAKLIQKLNHDNIPNFEEIDIRILEDAEMQELLEYSVPYIFGVTGLAYNSWKSAEIPLNWSFLFEPGKDLPPAARRNVEYTYNGHMTLIDDMQLTLGTALVYLGYEIETDSAEAINEAAELLVRAIEELDIELESTHVAKKLVSGELYMAMCWSGDAMAAMEDSLHKRRELEHEQIALLKEGQTRLKATVRDEIPKIRFTSPHPQALAFIDCFSIVQGSPNVENAEKLLNFLLRPPNAAAVTNFSYYGNTVSASKEFVSRDILNGPPYFLPNDNSVRFIRELDEDTHQLYVDAWVKVKEADKKNKDSKQENDEATEMASK